jgi:hypothetical protein
MKIEQMVIDLEGVSVRYWCAQDPQFKSDWRHGLRAQAWCYEQWGSSEYLTEVPGWNRISDDTFMFNSEDKLIAFQLRWACD